MSTKPDQGLTDVNTEKFTFVGRVAEADAMRQSLQNVAHKLRGQTEIDTHELRNVLVYDGQPGMGKTRLSERLEAWCRCDLSETDAWGPPPMAEPVRTARWNFIGFQGQIDAPALLIALRAAVTTRKQKWPAFDLALAAYLSAARPGQRLATTTAADQTDDIISVLGDIAKELGAPDLVTDFSVGVITKLVVLAMKKFNESRQLKRFSSLRTILDRCGRIPIGETAPDVAADILWLLSEEVEQCEASKRPVVAVFVDHFEKLQADDAIKAEQVINLFMGCLPWVLFIITGRQKLGWYENRDGLKFSGLDKWPLLALEDGEEPHQHSLGHLSTAETRDLLRHRRQLEGWRMSDELLEKIIIKSDQWPLHIAAVCQIAGNRTGELTEEILVKLPDLVKYLFGDLSTEEAHVFNAACLLPYFDVPLVAAIAGTTEGAVDRCMQHTIIDPNPNSLYPYRVHEEIRRLVRQAGSTIKGGWSNHDWQQAAERALTEAKNRHSLAQEIADQAEREGKIRNDAPVIEAIVLGLTVALQEDVYDDWLGAAIRQSPTIRGLASYLPLPNAEQATTEAGALIRHVQALALPGAEGIPILEDLWSGTTKVKRSSGLWLAYRLRTEGRYSECIQQFTNLMKLPGTTATQEDLYHRQLATCLRQERLYRQAIAYFKQTLEEGHIEYSNFVAICLQNNGIFGQPKRIFEERIARQASARFRMELRTTYLHTRVLEGEDCRSEAQQLLEKSIELAMPAYQMNCLWAVGTFQLAQPELLAETTYRMRQLIPQYHNTALLCELLALKAFLTGDHADVEEARDCVPPFSIRRSSLIFTEVLLDELGSPLPPNNPPEEWLIPYADVRRNWLTLAAGVVDRATSLA